MKSRFRRSGTLTRTMRIRSRRLALWLLLGSAGACGAHPTPTPTPTPTPAPAPAPAAEAASVLAAAAPACTPNEYLAPTPTGDVEWLRSLTRELAAGASRKRLACLLGTDPEPDGDYVVVKPHGSGLRPRIFVGVGDDAEKGVRLEFFGNASPSRAAVEAVLGKSHVGPARFPHARVIDLAGPDGFLVYAVLDVYADAPRLMAIELHRSDPQGRPSRLARTADGGVAIPAGFRPPEIAEVWVTPPAKRFPAGTWTFELSEGSKGVALTTARCVVPEDLFEQGTCTPSFDQYPGAKQGTCANSIQLHVAGRPAELGIRVVHDGAVIAERRVKLTYQTSWGAGSLDLRP